MKHIRFTIYYTIFFIMTYFVISCSKESDLKENNLNINSEQLWLNVKKQVLNMDCSFETGVDFLLKNRTTFDNEKSIAQLNENIPSQPISITQSDASATTIVSSGTSGMQFNHYMTNNTPQGTSVHQVTLEATTYDKLIVFNNSDQTISIVVMGTYSLMLASLVEAGNSIDINVDSLFGYDAQAFSYIIAGPLPIIGNVNTYLYYDFYED